MSSWTETSCAARCQSSEASGVEELRGFGRVDAHPLEDLEFLVGGGVADVDLHEEAVALGFGEG